MMHQSIEIKRYLISLVCFMMYSLSTYTANIKVPLTLESLNLPKNVTKNLSKKIYSKAKVETLKLNKNKQKLDLHVVGLHPKKCVIALSKISQLERYDEFISFIKESRYDDKTQMISLKLSHLLMPYDMSLVFNIKRPTEPGDYPFIFHNGFLKGLKGLIRIAVHEKRCLFSMQANWQGKKTKIGDRVFSFFLEFLGEKLMNRLFHISRTL